MTLFDLLSEKPHILGFMLSYLGGDDQIDILRSLMLSSATFYNLQFTSSDEDFSRPISEAYQQALLCSFMRDRYTNRYTDSPLTKILEEVKKARGEHLKGIYHKTKSVVESEIRKKIATDTVQTVFASSDPTRVQFMSLAKAFCSIGFFVGGELAMLVWDPFSSVAYDVLLGAGPGVLYLAGVVATMACRDSFRPNNKKFNLIFGINNDEQVGLLDSDIESGNGVSYGAF